MNIDLEALERKILSRDIASLGRAITLNESTRLEDNQIIDEIISKHSNKLNDSLVISISGIPGVGKSSFIEVFGTFLHGLGNSIAVFSIDPSSEETQGSILGDKTRMTELSKLDNVFIRPSPSSNKLGGLGINTHKNIELAKIAGFDIILVETVGVGQSETIVKNLCDLFLLLLMPASGDELQGIKRGIMEVADYYIIHKADGDLKNIARKSMKEVEIALHMTRQNFDFNNQIFSFSSVEKEGLEEIWKSIEAFIEKRKSENQFQENRIQQRLYWLKEAFETLLLKHYSEKHKADYEGLKSNVKNGEFIALSKILRIISF